MPEESDHAWNAVKIDGEWKLIDLAWAAGIVDSGTGRFKQVFNDAYFFTDPEKFFHNHFPENKKWLLVNKSPAEFANQPFYYPTYIKSDYSISNDKGFIRISDDMPIEFSIGNLKPDDRVYYLTSGGTELDRVRMDDDNNFRIYPDSGMNGYLTLFINERPVVAYKIQRG